MFYRGNGWKMIAPTADGHQNLWRLVVQLFLPLLSPASCGYPSRELIRPTSASVTRAEPSDIRVTLYDASDFEGPDRKLTVRSTDAKQQFDDYAPPSWQLQPPSLSVGILELESYATMNGYPAAAYFTRKLAQRNLCWD
jgi:hypothetical protein